MPLNIANIVRLGVSPVANNFPKINVYNLPFEAIDTNLFENWNVHPLSGNFGRTLHNAINDGRGDYKLCYFGQCANCWHIARGKSCFEYLIKLK